MFPIRWCQAKSLVGYLLISLFNFWASRFFFIIYSSSWSFVIRIFSELFVTHSNQSFVNCSWSSVYQNWLYIIFHVKINYIPTIVTNTNLSCYWKHTWSDKNVLCGTKHKFNFVTKKRHAAHFMISSSIFTWLNKLNEVAWECVIP